MFLRLQTLAALTALLTLSACTKPVQQADTNDTALTVEALPRMLRVDLVWPNQGEGLHYQVQRAESADGAFTALEHMTPTVHLFSDYIGEADVTRYYRVRTINPADKALG